MASGGEKHVSFNQDKEVVFLGEDGKNVKVSARVDVLDQEPTRDASSPVPLKDKLKRNLNKLLTEFFEKTKQVKAGIEEDLRNFLENFEADENEAKQFKDLGLNFKRAVEELEGQVTEAAKENEERAEESEERAEVSYEAAEVGDVSFFVPPELILGMWTLEREELFPEQFVSFPELTLEALEFVNPDDLSLLAAVQGRLCGSGIPVTPYEPNEEQFGMVSFRFERAFLEQLLKDW